MRISLAVKMALRSLGRNTRRTVLSVVGVGVGVAIALFINAFMRGGAHIRVRAISESGFGHIRLAPSSWLPSRTHELRLPDWDTLLAWAKARPEILVAAPHARTMALVAFGTKVTGVEILGVDPRAERALSRVARAVSRGRYLRDSDRGAAVIGSTIADRLDVDVDDDLMLTVVGAGGQLHYAMATVVGIIATGSRELDAGVCHMKLADLEELTGIPGAAEITIALRDVDALDRATKRYAREVGPGVAVLTWRDVVPSQGGDAASDRAFMRLVTGIVALVVLLGITSAQLTAILERRRELAVLMALGMKTREVSRAVFIEALAIGMLGTIVGLALGGPLVWWSASRGFDFSGVMGGDTNVGGVLFDPVIYPDAGPWVVPYGAALALASTALAAVYPAWHVARMHIPSVVSMRER